MDTEYRYILERGSKKHICPNCGKKSLKRYIDKETDQYLPYHYGRCDHENSCVPHYHLNPYLNGYIKTIREQDRSGLSNFQPQHLAIANKQKPTSYISAETLQASLKEYESNHFVEILIKHFGIQATTTLLSKYYIGTSRHWIGANVFWQIDQYKRIRTGKIMLYNPATDKRVKEPFNHITWAHTALKLPNFILRQCLYGSHLLIDRDKPVAIVESEKTAIIASLYFPNFIWLATGGKNGCKWASLETLNTLKGRKVILWPDANAFDSWSESASELRKSGIDVVVSDLVERNASAQERKVGVDIADYLLKDSLNLFSPEQMPRPP